MDFLSKLCINNHFETITEIITFEIATEISHFEDHSKSKLHEFVVNMPRAPLIKLKREALS